MAGGGGWSNLPLDLFSFTFSKLSLPELVRSAVVCVSWSASAHEVLTLGRRFKFRGQSPWLMFGGGPDGDPSAATFYTFDESREYTIPLPDPPLTDRVVIGSAHGWVIAADTHRGRLQLLNPITGAQIDLPSILSFDHIDPVPDEAGNLIGYIVRKPATQRESSEVIGFIPSSTVMSLPMFHHFKAILSADPSLGDDFTVAVIHFPYCNISFTRPGYEKWFTLTNTIAAQDILFHEGKLYVATMPGDVLVCDFDEIQIRHGEMPAFTEVVRQRHLTDHLHYLARTPRGDLLNVCREREEGTTDTVSVKVYRVVEEEEEASKRLQEVKDLGELIIFLGSNQPICLSASDFPHLTPNSIYFTDDDIEPICFRRHVIDFFEKGASSPLPLDVGVYDMADQTFRHILPGDIRLYWPPPVWLLI